MSKKLKMPASLKEFDWLFWGFPLFALLFLLLVFVGCLGLADGKVTTSFVYEVKVK